MSAESSKPFIQLLVTTYYAVQKLRIQMGGRSYVKQEGERVEKLSGRIGSLIREGRLDEDQAEKLHSGLTHPIKAAEDFAKKEMEVWIKEHPLWDAWFVNVAGIGPIISAGLVALVDIRKATTVSKLWAYAGIHTVTYGIFRRGSKIRYKRWFPTESSAERWIAHRVSCDRLFYETAQKEGRIKKADISKTLAKSEKAYREGTCFGEEVERKQMAARRIRGMKIDWNPALSTLCWKIGESFVKTGKGYRDMYLEFKESYLEKLRAQAETTGIEKKDALEEVSEDEDLEPEKPTTDYDEAEAAQASSDSGMKGIKLIAHRRAKRKTVKIFLAHTWEKWRVLEGLPVRPAYILEHGHSKYIEPPAA